MKEREEMVRQPQQNSIPISKAAPWSQPSLPAGASLEEIQKAERQKRAEQAALLQQQRALQQQQQQQVIISQSRFVLWFYLIFFVTIKEQQQSTDKPGQLQLKWAIKPIESRKVKSLAEIQAEEEHERLAKVYRLLIMYFCLAFKRVRHCSRWRKRA